MRDFLAEFVNGDFDSQLLAQLAAQTLFKRLAFMPFAAGKFPQAAEVRVGVALCDEEFAGAEDQSRRDFDELRTHLTQFNSFNRNYPLRIRC